MSTQKASTVKVTERAALRLANSPAFIASLLIRSNEPIDTADIEAELQCDRDAILQMCLCRIPARDSETFRAEVKQISDLIAVDPGKIAVLLRRALSLQALRSDAQQALLAAARDSSCNENGPENE